MLDTTIRRDTKTQHNICWTPLCVNRHKNTTQHMLDTTIRKQTQKTQHNICWTPLYVNRHKNTTQHMLDTTIRKQTQKHNTTYVGHHYT